MTNDQLLQELQNRKLIREDVATKLRREAVVSGKSVEELAFERRIVDDQKIAEAKSQVLGVPYKKIDAAQIDEAVLQLIPEETVRTYAVVPLSKENDVFVVGMVHPDDVKAQEALRFIASRNHLNLGVYLLTFGDWQDVLRRYSPYRSSVEAAVKTLNIRSGELPGGRKVVSLDEDLGKGAEEAPIVKIVLDTFKEALQDRASDIHFEPQENFMRVRFRIDGDLKEVATLPAELSAAITSRVKVISNLKIDETRVPQDGRFRSRIFEREIDFRVATFPTPLGEKIAIRILDPSTGLKNFDQLGLVGPNMKMIKEGLEKPYGMILVTGPTGSGKTTTLYALLQALNKEEVNIVSLEDPVEYFVSGVNQSQVHPDIGYDFASGLRQILRQDPDVIMVGEIRDAETASLAIQAALTGHIVLSTLHTNNAAGVIPRLLDMKVDSFLLPVALNLMVGQRLVGRLCPDCKVSAPASPALTEEIEKSIKDVPDELKAEIKKPYEIYHAPGCAKCRGRGVVGRVAIHETLRMSPSLGEAISSGGASLQKIQMEGKKQGMITLREDGVLKALAGTVSLEEVLRTTTDE
jgi:type IV pilus assembly protein PilB